MISKILLLIHLFFLNPQQDKVNSCNIYGKIQIVPINQADYKVFVDNFNPDMSIKISEFQTDQPLNWQFVQSFGKYKIAFVNLKSRADFSVKFVNNFPRCFNRK